MIKTYLITLQRVNKSNRVCASILPTFKYQASADDQLGDIMKDVVGNFNKKDTCGYEYIIQDIKTLDDFKYMDEVLKSIL